MGRDYRLLLAANFVSFIGDWILSAGLVYQVYVLTGSALAGAGMVLAMLIPQLTLGSFAGVLVDRWDRRRTMITCNLLLAGTLLPLWWVTDPARVPLVFAVAAVHSALETCFASAEAAVVPSLVDEKRLVTANALNGQARDVARLVGAALGGVLASAGGIRLIAVADGATFVAAAGLLTLIRYRAHRPGAPAAAPRVLSEWLAGTRLAAANRTLRTLMTFALITGVGEAIMMTLMAPVWPALVIMVLVGLPGALTVAGLVTVFQTATDDAHRGRVYGALTALKAGAMLAGTVLAGALADRAGVVPVIAVQGVAYLSAGLLVLAALPRPARPVLV